MKLNELHVPYDIDPGATMPEIKADEHNLEVTFDLLDSDLRGKLKFKWVLQFTFGYPNEEAINGHRYYKFGLMPFMFVEIQDSEIIKNISAANKVHPYHNEEHFKKYRHFVFPFHDTTLEVIAILYEFEQPVKPEFSFDKTTMSDTRKADFFLGRLGETAFLKADKHKWSKEELKAYDNVTIKEQDERGEKELVAIKAKEEGKIEMILEMYKQGFTVPQIAKVSKKSEKEVAQIIDDHKNE